MMAIPLKVNEAEMDLFVILQPENIERLIKYDPAELVKHKMGQYAELSIRNIVITFANDSDVATVMPMLQNGDVTSALKHLTRGWVFRPQEGDNDEEYEQSSARWLM